MVTLNFDLSYRSITYLVDLLRFVAMSLWFEANVQQCRRWKRFGEVREVARVQVKPRAIQKCPPFIRSDDC